MKWMRHRQTESATKKTRKSETKKSASVYDLVDGLSNVYDIQKLCLKRNGRKPHW